MTIDPGPQGDNAAGPGGDVGSFDSGGVRTLEAQLAQERRSLSEFRHRVRNQFQMIISLLRLQAGEAADPAVGRALERAAARTETLVLAAREMEEADERGLVRLDGVLETLADAKASLLEARGIQTVLDCQPVATRSEIGVPIALLVNEILLNVLDHAFPEGRRGTVKLVVAVAGRELKVLVADDGVGLPASVADGSGGGPGMRLIHGLAAQIGADVVIEGTSGTSILVSVPENRWRPA